MRTIYSLLILIVASGPVVGQERLGLLDIYELALANDPLIREAEANFLAQSEVKAQARSGLLPTLSIGGSRGEGISSTDRPQDFLTGQPDPNILNTETDSESTSFNFTLSQTVFDWGQYLSLKQADKTIAWAEVNLEAIRQELIIRVAIAYFSVLSAEDNLAAQNAALEALRQQLEQTQRRFDVGLIAITNVQEAQAGYDQAVADVIVSEQQLSSAQESLREIINGYALTLKSPIAELPLLTPEPNNVETWVDIAQSQNLALVASRIDADIAQDGIQIARSSRFPRLSLSANADDFSNTNTTDVNLVGGGLGPGSGVPRISGGDRANISLNLSVPIFNGGLNRSRIQQQVFQHRAAVEGVERITRQTERQTRDAFRNVTSDISRIEALAQLVESSRSSLLATQASEEVGQRTGVDVVIAQNNLSRAETSYAAARYQYLLDLLSLKQAAGNLTEDDLAQVEGWLE